MKGKREDKIRAALAEGMELRQRLMDDSFFQGLIRATDSMVQALKKGNKILIFGNGGSAAHAQHMAAELVNRFLKQRQPFAALALTTDTSILTSISNDEDFTEVFARQISALGRPGDVAVAITTSGRSRNILRGLEEARRIGLVTVGLTGGNGQEVNPLLDHSLHVPHGSTPRVQEMHTTVIHILCELIEDELSD
jgi:D-sedoheptulose 7-phosphate isomerase